MTNPAGNGPRNGRGSGRFRDTLANNASKTLGPGGYQAPISSASAVGYGDQLAQSRYAYLSQLAALRAQRTQVGQQYGVARADAQSNAIGGMVSAESDALERGIVGSSVDAQTRTGVIADRTRAFAEAEQARAMGRLGLAQQGIDARSQYYMNTSSIQNQMAQEQMTNTISAFQNDQFNALNQNYQALYQSILDQLTAEKRGDRPRTRTGLRAPNAVAGMVNGTVPYNDRKYEGTI